MATLRSPLLGMRGEQGTSSGTAMHAGPTKGATGGANSSTDPEAVNKMFAGYLYLVIGSLTIALILWRATTMGIKYIRTVSSLNNDTQRYFALASGRVSWFKRNIMYAPISRKRHNREIMLTHAVNVGTPPTRLQLAFLLGYFATNVAFAVITIDWSMPFTTVAAMFRNRAGVLATVNMIPLVLMSGRNNPLIKLLGLSFDTFNLLHRWFGRIIILEALAHIVAYFAGKTKKESLAACFQTVFNTPYTLAGFVAVCAFFVMGVQAASIFRHAGYETFKIVHIILAITAIVSLYYHLHLDQLPEIQYLIPAIVLWGLERTIRLIRIAYINVGSGGTKAIVEALPGGACRVTVTMARPWTFKPGQHAYLYFPGISYWQSHPFSVAWSDQAGQVTLNNEAGQVTLDGEKPPTDRQDVEVLANGKTSMSFVIRARTGFTAKLHRNASQQGRMATKCMVEGPYGGLHMMRSYGTVMLFAGGIGITNAVPHVRDLVAGFSNGTVATRKIVLVWVSQSPEHLEWIRPWMTEILAMDRRRECLRIMLFVSRPRSSKEVHSPSETVLMFPGRPNIDTLIGAEMENQVGTMGVTVCGPGTLSDEVRLVVRKRLSQGLALEFVEEAFSW